MNYFFASSNLKKGVGGGRVLSAVVNALWPRACLLVVKQLSCLFSQMGIIK